MNFANLLFPPKIFHPLPPQTIKKYLWNVEIGFGPGSLTRAVEAIPYVAIHFIFKPFKIAEILSLFSKARE